MLHSLKCERRHPVKPAVQTAGQPTATLQRQRVTPFAMTLVPGLRQAMIHVVQGNKENAEGIHAEECPYGRPRLTGTDALIAPPVVV